MHLQLNRRGFLSTLTSTCAGVALTGCRSTSTPPSAGSLTIIDTHTHFYDPTRPQGVPWPPPDDKVLYRTVLPATYLALPTPHPVAGTVVVEASPLVEDNQWILDLAAREPFIVGFVGNLPLGTPPFAGHLKRFLAQKLFRGVRLRNRKLDGLSTDDAFLADLRLLAASNLSLDLVGGPEILPFADRLARAVPDLRIIIDHLAGLRIDGQAPPADWLDQVKTLARHRHVYLKVSGLVEGSGRRGGAAPRDTAFYRPTLDAIWTLFGPHRLVYGSNWPVCEHYASLATVQAIVHDYFSGHGPNALADVFSRNSQSAYAWQPRNFPRDRPPTTKAL